MKVHYGREDHWSESGYDEGDDKTLCGIEGFEGSMSTDEELVSCKNCLKRLPKPDIKPHKS